MLTSWHLNEKSREVFVKARSPTALHIKVFAVPFRVLTEENIRRMCYVRISISDHASKTGSWYLLGVPLKISDEHPRLFYSFPPRGDQKIIRVTISNLWRLPTN